MTAADIARLLNARKVGRGKWIAKCVAHPDRNPSLSIAEGNKVPVVLKCMSAGCETSAILAAMGLSWDALFNGKPKPEIRAILSLKEQKDSLERQLGLVAVLQAVEREKRAYWAAAERRMRGELEQVRCRLEPEEVWREYQARRIKQCGFEKMWEEVYGDDSGYETQAQERRKMQAVLP